MAAVIVLTASRAAALSSVSEDPERPVPAGPDPGRAWIAEDPGHPIEPEYEPEEPALEYEPPEGPALEYEPEYEPEEPALEYEPEPSSDSLNVDSESAVKYLFAGGASAAVNFREERAAGVVLGFQLWERDDFYFNVNIRHGLQHVIEVTEPETPSFGSFVLNPWSGGPSGSISASVTPIRGKVFMAGLFAKTLGAAAIWRIRPTTDGSGSLSEASFLAEREVFVGAANAGFQFVSRTFGEANEYQGGIEIGVGGRAIGGSVSGDEAFLRSEYALGTDAFLYYGAEGSIFVRMNSIVGYLRMVYFRNREDSQVLGLTRFQGFAGVDVLSAFVRSH